MGQEPEELRAELASKRDDLAYDLEAIGDRVSPGRVVERRQAAVRMRFADMRDRAMGTRDSAFGTVQHGAHSATSTMTDTAGRIGQAAKERTEGAPLAVGLMAFGAGVVAAAMFPATRREQRLAEQAQPAVERAAAEIAPAAKQVAEDVRPAAEGAVDELKDEAKQAASNVGEQTKQSASEVRGEVREKASSTSQPGS